MPAVEIQMLAMSKDLMQLTICIPNAITVISCFALQFITVGLIIVQLYRSIIGCKKPISSHRADKLNESISDRLSNPTDASPDYPL